MKINEYEKLDKKISNYNFRDSYKNINLILIVLTIVGHLTAIFLSNFLLVDVFSSIIDNLLLVNIISIVILTIMELLKRDFFDKFSFQHLKSKNIFSKDVMPLAIVSFIIVCLSFYASLKGAKEFSSKSDEIEISKELNIKTYEDSINYLYADKIKFIESEILSEKSKIEDKDKEQTEISSLERLNTNQKNRIKDLKSDKSEIKLNIVKLESDLSKIKIERDLEISKYSDKISIKTEKEKDSNKSNSIFFVVVSTLIELSILFGVYFKNYYKYRSYTDFKKQIESNPNYQKWVSSSKMLEILYLEDRSMGDKIPSSKSLLDISKINRLKSSQKDINDFLKLSNSLGIVKTQGGVRYLQKSYESAYESIKDHFNIE